MADKNLIATVWGAKLLKTLENTCVFYNLTSHDYIENGNKLIVNRLNNPTIKDYTPDTTDLEYESITGESFEIPMNFSKYFAVSIDDVIRVQESADSLGMTGNNAADAMRQQLDTYLSGQISAGAKITLDSSSSAKLSLDSTNIISTIAKIGEALDKAKAPEYGRYIVIPPFVKRLLILESIDKLTNNTEVTQTGYIGSIGGINIYSSNNINEIIGGVTEGATSVMQIDKIETITLQNQFGEALRGLCVAGAVSTLPSCSVKIYAEEKETA